MRRLPPLVVVGESTRVGGADDANEARLSECKGAPLHVSVAHNSASLVV